MGAPSTARDSLLRLVAEIPNNAPQLDPAKSLTVDSSNHAINDAARALPAMQSLGLRRHQLTGRKLVGLYQVRKHGSRPFVLTGANVRLC